MCPHVVLLAVCGCESLFRWWVEKDEGHNLAALVGFYSRQKFRPLASACSTFIFTPIDRDVNEKGEHYSDNRQSLQP
jgi:hypothetical protein